MGVYGGSLANRRMIMLAVLSLIASLLTATFNAPAANAAAGDVIVTPTALTVAEGATGLSYAITLGSEPTADVTIAVSSGAETTLSTSSVLLDASNWDTGTATVTVTAVDDDVDDDGVGDTVVNANTVSTDGDYSDKVVSNVIVTITDNDTAGIVVDTLDGLSVLEGAPADTFTVVLASEPTADVTVAAVSTGGQIALAPTELTYTASNWDDPQTISVTALEDGLDEPDPHQDLIALSTTSADPQYDDYPLTDVVVSIGDADSLLVIIDGPSFGSPGRASVFTAVVNAGGTGMVDYEWTVVFGGNPIASGDEPTFSFIPTEGGAYVVRALVGDTQGQNPAVFSQFTALGDIETSTFVEDIIWMAEEGITLGCNPPANDNFCPTKTVTRGQMAAFLVRFLGLTAIDPSIAFTDTGSSVFEQDILKLATAGITRGCNADGTQFCPNKGVTRGQMAAFLVRAFSLTDNGGGDLFTDDDTSIFENDIDKLATAKITLGCNPPTNSNFCPTKTVTRGQMSAFLHRAEGLVLSKSG